MSAPTVTPASARALCAAERRDEQHGGAAPGSGDAPRATRAQHRGDGLISRRTVIGVQLAMLAGTNLTLAQSRERIARIGWLGSGAAPGGPAESQFPAELAKLGHALGRDVILDARWSEGRADRYEALAAELVALRPDVIITSGARCEVVQSLTRTIPIVCSNMDEPISRGLARSYARPGGNVTGIQLMTRELFQKRLEIVREALPGMRRLGVLALPETDWLLPDGEAAARRLGLTLEIRRFDSDEGLDAALAALFATGIDALVTTQGPLLNRLRDRIVAFGTRARLPTISGETGSAAAGGLIQFGPDVEANWRRAAFYVDRILSGASAAELPIEQPSVTLVVNLRVAAALGLKLPATIVARADMVID
ncbi:MAG: ABC transporter substrate-binding protein [Alphaproteobacteria bacterium]|nr:ABC transporter substrate-binding protein [Alphaproteobacteria bacterium]